MTAEPENLNGPVPGLFRDPPGILRRILQRVFARVIEPEARAKSRGKAEAARVKNGEPHRIEYFHQYDDPYSHLSIQVLDRLAERYDIELVTHQIRASGGANQPELEKLYAWAKRDADLIAPHYGLQKPSTLPAEVEPDRASLDAGSARLAELGHYSGAMFHYGGEWFWGVDRLFYLEQWLRDLGACKDASIPFICPRPEIDVGDVDASHLTLDFYPSLNSPYTSIIYDLTVDMARTCGIQLKHKPVLPMIMRGVSVTRDKSFYIMADTKREAEHLGVPFEPPMMPVGKPTRQIYSLLPWAREQGKDIALLSASLRLAFAEGVALHRRSGLRKAIEQAGLDWKEAQAHIGTDRWKAYTLENQNEMIDALGLWGVPSYRLRGSDGVADLSVWGQDRLWLIAAEIRKRCGG